MRSERGQWRVSREEVVENGEKVENVAVCGSLEMYE